jgi:uncharacterized membrane protein YbhN (UPF0104 family)
VSASADTTGRLGDAEPIAPQDDEGRRLRRGIVSLAILVVLVGALVFSVPGLDDVADRLRDVDPGWIVLAVVLELLSCAGYVLAFQGVFDRVPRRFAARVALSEMAFGAVVPAGGAGGIALGAWIVKAKGGPLRRFVQRSAVLFLLTSAVNAGTLVLAGLLVGLGVLDAPHHLLLGFVPAGAGLLVMGLFAAVPRLARRFPAGDAAGRAARWLDATAGVVRDTLHELVRPRWRLAGAIGYLWFDIAMLWVCFRALGDAPPVGAITLAFLIGYLGNVVPIPGGIGALDGGLAAALVLYGADAATAAAAVLAYHSLVLWIPTLVGTLAFLRVRRTIDEPIVLRPGS